MVIIFLASTHLFQSHLFSLQFFLVFVFWSNLSVKFAHFLVYISKLFILNFVYFSLVKVLSCQLIQYNFIIIIINIITDCNMKQLSKCWTFHSHTIVMSHTHKYTFTHMVLSQMILITCFLFSLQ